MLSVCVSRVTTKVVAISNRSSRTSRPGYVFSAVDRNVYLTLFDLFFFYYCYYHYYCYYYYFFFFFFLFYDIYVYVFFLLFTPLPPSFLFTCPSCLCSTNARVARARACIVGVGLLLVAPLNPLSLDSEEPGRFATCFCVTCTSPTSTSLLPYSTLVS